MKRLIILALLVAGVIYGLRVYDRSKGESNVRARVQNMLDAFKRGEEQPAFFRWCAIEKQVMDTVTMDKYYTAFLAFCRETSLNDRSDWAILSIKVLDSGGTALVVVASGGRQVTLWVPPRTPMELRGSE